ncbi:response regulator [Candidatus Parcubacteria bacterium]|nr:response regulator [Candidatus Parcubacteria bacterium]
MARILVVGSNPGSFRVRKWLESRGHEVEVVAGARGAYAHLADQNVDLIISGYDLGGENGLQFLRKLKMDRERRGLPFILRSGALAKEVREEIVELGGQFLREDSPSWEQTLEQKMRAMLQAPRVCRAAE